VSLTSAEHDLQTIAQKPVISITDFEAATGVVDQVLQVHILLEHTVYMLWGGGGGLFAVLLHGEPG
jgi:hypothetical protein